MFDDELYHYGIKGMRWGVRRTPEELGHKHKNHAIKALQNDLKKIGYKEFDKLQSPEETRRRGAGSCHDQVIYELDRLNKAGVKAHARFMIEYNPKTGQGGTTHSYVYIPTKSGVYWLENSYRGQEGLHKFNSVGDIEKNFRKLRKKGSWGNYKRFSNVEFQDFNPRDHKYGEDLQTLINRTLK